MPIFEKLGKLIELIKEAMQLYSHRLIFNNLVLYFNVKLMEAKQEWELVLEQEETFSVEPPLQNQNKFLNNRHWNRKIIALIKKMLLLIRLLNSSPMTSFRFLKSIERYVKEKAN